MAAPTRSANYNSLGVSAGPDSTVLVDTGGYTAAADIEFGVLGPLESIEATIVFVKTGAAPSVTFTIQAFDDAAQTWITLLAGAALAANGTQNLLVGPYAPNVNNVSAAHVLRNRMRVDIAVGNTDVGTYSVSINAL
jgi:hypothetical protein